MESGDPLHNVSFSDECSISLQSYHRTCIRMADKPTKRKPKPKHPFKVHVWGGISRHGATKICIFDGIMDGDLFCNVLETTLVPFIRNKLPDHWFMQDNDPNTCPGEHKLSSSRKALTGGVLLRRVLTSTQSKTCGMNSSSTWNLKSSHATSKSW